MSSRLLPDPLEGAVDLHVHSAPDTDPRRFNDIELVTEAQRAGMGGVLIKSHQNSTVERAWLVSQVVPGIMVRGGLVLNTTVGGLNPEAVKLAVDLGAAEIWMPTRSARNHRRHHGQGGGLSVLDRDGGLTEETEAILRLVAAGGCILGTGHLSPEEVLALVPRAKKLGVARILITHPEWSATYYPVDMQARLASLGGVYFERCFVSMTHRCGHTPFATIERAIADVGVASTVLSTDLGQPDTPPPVEGLRDYAERLRAAGYSPDDLRRMMCVNPAALLARAERAIPA